MIEQLKEMFEMQKDFDNQVLMKLGKKYDYEIACKITMALFVEIGELMQELPSYFKFWKQNKQDNRDKALEEYVDALKFCLSLFSYIEDDIYSIEEIVESIESFKKGVFYYPKDQIDSVIECVLTGIFNNNGIEQLCYMFNLLDLLGFTFDEIYETFKKKHAINLQRMKDGY